MRREGGKVAQPVERERFSDELLDLGVEDERHGGAHGEEGGPLGGGGGGGGAGGGRSGEEGVDEEDRRGEREQRRQEADEEIGARQGGGGSRRPCPIARRCSRRRRGGRHEADGDVAVRRGEQQEAERGRQQGEHGCGAPQDGDERERGGGGQEGGDEAAAVGELDEGGERLVERVRRAAVHREADLRERAEEHAVGRAKALRHAARVPARVLSRLLHTHTGRRKRRRRVRAAPPTWSKKERKYAALGLPAWSPTAVLPELEPAYIPCSDGKGRPWLIWPHMRREGSALDMKVVERASRFRSWRLSRADLSAAGVSGAPCAFWSS